ncbi:MAG: DNA repair protein RecN [Brevundimonas sp.]|jgi:DNA repair protein RecN (Recombination protein N)|uniref:DNA repair protein RecN n=1 Tax=Brevundimonas sp. TaxID=1871086 RepID=UPI003918E667
MLSLLSIRDVVLIEALDLEVGPGLTVLTGETGAGKSIILDALGLVLGARADAGLVRTGAKGASVSASFDLPPDHSIFSRLAERGIDADPSEGLILRRTLGSDGRSRAFINDAPVGVTALREITTSLVEVHGQHETIGLLDARTHAGLLDAFGAHAGQLAEVRAAFVAWREARRRLDEMRLEAERAAGEVEDMRATLDELDRLNPREGEEADLAGERAILGASEKALADLDAAREALGGDALTQKLAQAHRAITRAAERIGPSLSGDHPVLARLGDAAEAIDRTLVEATEALAAVDGVASVFDVDPSRLERVEERLFELRAMARKMRMDVEGLGVERERLRAVLHRIEDGGAALAEAEADLARLRRTFEGACASLSAARAAAAERLGAAVMAELEPLRLGRARFHVALTPLADDQWGEQGAERVRFEISTNPGSPFGPLDAIASGGELARFALALKAALASRGDGPQPLMIFDEVDQGVGGAVAEAVGQRLDRLARDAQVMVVTHSPQVAAFGRAHWKVSKAEAGSGTVTRLDVLGTESSEEEIARMLSGAEVTDAARAAARALRRAG